MNAPPQVSRGFTLLELLCSMFLGTLVLLAAASLLGMSGDSYQRIGGGVYAGHEARAVLSQISSDLAGALFHKDCPLEQSQKHWPISRIGFLSLQPADAQSSNGGIGDLCSIHYYVEDIWIGGKNERCLMRGFHESSDVFRAIGNDTVSSLFTKRNTYDEPIAFGVISFEMIPKTLDPKGRWMNWVKDESRGPMAMDVRLVIARRELSAKLKKTDDWDGATISKNWLGEPSNSDTHKNLEVYATLIRFGNDNNP